jgi:hypothetical protein
MVEHDYIEVYPVDKFFTSFGKKTYYCIKHDKFKEEEQQNENQD